MILLEDILHLSNLSNPIKVKFNIWNGEVEPIDEYLKDPDIVNNQWCMWRNETRNYNVGDISVCLVRIRGDLWLLTSIQEITKEFNVTEGINYEGRELSQYSQFFGRVILQFHKNGAYSCAFYDTVKSRLEVSEILSATYDGFSFPGYDKVSLTFEQLRIILRNNRADWINALSSQKAVYLLTDCKTGKLYVGSATSHTGMLLSRWSSYISSYSGGNVKLTDLLNNEGPKYFERYFRFTIIENYNQSVSDDYILSRESYWKDVLKTREFGYNDN